MKRNEIYMNDIPSRDSFSTPTQRALKTFVESTALKPSDLILKPFVFDVFMALN